jgi:hypothetical protein
MKIIQKYKIKFESFPFTQKNIFSLFDGNGVIRFFNLIIN